MKRKIKNLKPGDVFLNSFGVLIEIVSVKPLPKSERFPEQVEVQYKNYAGSGTMEMRADREVESHSFGGE